MQDAATVSVFRDRTLSAGLIFSHLQGDEKLTGLDEVIGPGACVLDYDNDGWMDLFLVNGSGQTRFYGSRYWWHLPKGHRLYRNLGNGKFQDVTDKAGLRRQSWGMGCAAGDLDNDGNVDLLVTNYGENILYKNTGNGSFTDLTGTAGIGGAAWSTSAALADYDGDGLLDIYVVNYLDYKKGEHTYESGSQFRGDTSVYFDPTLYAGVPNRLYHNQGNFRFRDVTAEAGVADTSGRGLAALWLDVNDDRKPDLLVSNDTGFPNALFINEDGRFRELGESYLLNDATATRATVPADIDGDGRPELIMGTGAGRSNAVLRRKNERTGYQDQGRATGIATEASAELDSWSITTADFNNDGWIDVAGFAGLAATDPDSYKVSLGQPNRLWLNDRGGRFKEASQQAGVTFADALSSRGAVTADFDNDGDVDIYVAHNNDLGQLLINDTPRRHWVGFWLEGVEDNRDAVGATVTLETGDGVQVKSVNNAGFLSSSDPRVVFGLGANRDIKHVNIRWYNGDNVSIDGIAADHYYRITQGSNTARAMPAHAHKPNPAKSAPFTIGADKAIHRAQYISWYGATDSPAAESLLQRALSDPDPDVRLAAVESTRRLKNMTRLALLTQALEDPDPRVRLKVIDGLEQLESEYSSRWLLRGLRDPSPRVRQRTAQMFEHFFREEEAMVYRKYLAVPMLIELLNDADSDTRIAAIRALAEAERYRAVAPLLLLLSDADEQIRAQAIRAIGRIRERETIPSVLSHFTDSEESPLVRAHSLITLKRLGYEHYPSLMSKLATGPANAESTHSDLLTMRALLANDNDTVVVSRPALTRQLLRRGRVLTGAATRKPNAIAAVEALAATRNKQAATIVSRFLQHSNAEVRASAVRALAELDPQRFRKTAQTVLRDPSATVRAATLQAALAANLLLPAAELKAALADAGTRETAIRLLAHTLPAEIKRKLRHIAFDTQAPGEVRIAALEKLASGKGLATVLGDALMRDKHAPIRAKAVELWGRHQSTTVGKGTMPRVITAAVADTDPIVQRAAIEVLLSRREAWATRTLETTLTNLKIDIDVRRYLLQRLANQGGRYHARTVWRLARLRHDPLSIEAVALLGEFPDTGQDDYLWQLLKNKDAGSDLRFAAATGLVQRRRGSVIKYLQQQ